MLLQIQIKPVKISFTTQALRALSFIKNLNYYSDKNDWFVEYFS